MPPSVIFWYLHTTERLSTNAIAARLNVKLSWVRRELKLRESVPHGTLYGYNKHKCRCTECRGVVNTYARQYRAACQARLGIPPKPPRPPKPPKPTRVPTRHPRVVNHGPRILELAAQRVPLVAIAERMGFSRSAVYKFLNTTLGSYAPEHPR